MLLEILKDRKCFKLVCGAGNEDANDVEKLVTLYSAAGANFFDISAKPEIVRAAKRGIINSGITNDRYICCSVGIKGDPHVNKAIIDNTKCSACGQCTKFCLENAIKRSNKNYEVIKTKCIGCGKCVKNCPANAIYTQSEPTDLNKVLPEIIKEGIDCIEFHCSGAEETEILTKWKIINNLFNGMLSICIDRSSLGNSRVLKRINKMIKDRKPYTTIIQADGCPMSGSRDDYKTTLQAIAMGEIIQDENLPVYMLLSGGTNSKTKELANLCSINYNGISIGTFARKIVNSYIQNDDFLENKAIFNEALKIAENLVQTSV